jgi:hypothetical protein
MRHGTPSRKRRYRRYRRLISFFAPSCQASKASK